MKILGFIFIVIGLLIALSSLKVVNEVVIKKIPQLVDFPEIYLIAIGVFLLFVGVLLIKVRRGRRHKGDLPIYFGDEVIGFRRG